MFVCIKETTQEFYAPKAYILLTFIKRDHKKVLYSEKNSVCPKFISNKRVFRKIKDRVVHVFLYSTQEVKPCMDTEKNFR